MFTHSEGLINFQGVLLYEIQTEGLQGFNSLEGMD